MTFELWMCRHGQTESNSLGIIQGQSECNLTDLGLKQAERLGERLASERFNWVYVSDLIRTRQTAAPILRDRADAVTVFEPRLREKSAGVLEGKPWSHLDRKGHPDIPWREWKVEGGESWVDVHTRLQDLLYEVMKLFSEAALTQPTPTLSSSADAVPTPAPAPAVAKALFVTHGGIIKEFCRSFIADPFELLAHNCALYIFRVQPLAAEDPEDQCTISTPSGRFRVTCELKNDASHLAGVESPWI
eukprot:GILI01008732.1.p1 GENE.GILI01008732.1~~GILI01008732.1.p1  ORF type:complete len:279 (-),score=80.01 GILI01008732.1:110-847(-)